MQKSSIPFVEAAHVGRKQRPTLVVLKASFTTSEKGAALGIANAWHTPVNKTMGSCHYVVDEAQVLQCVPDRVRAFPTGTGIYVNAISINVCYDPPDWPEKAVILRTAHLVAQLCKQHRIKVRILNPDQELRWMVRKWRSRGGILLKTSGEFPGDEFFASVLSEYKAL